MPPLRPPPIVDGSTCIPPIGRCPSPAGGRDREQHTPKRHTPPADGLTVQRRSIGAPGDVGILARRNRVRQTTRISRHPIVTWLIGPFWGVSTPEKTRSRATVPAPSPPGGRMATGPGRAAAPGADPLPWERSPPAPEAVRSARPAARETSARKGPCDDDSPRFRVAGPRRAAGRGRPGGLRRRHRRTAPPAADAGDDRQRELRPHRRHAGPGFGDDQQVRGGLSRPALLRRLRERRRHRTAGDRPDQGAVRGGLRQRAAALRGAGQRRRLPGADQARGHHPGTVPGARWAPDARHADQLLRAAVRGGRVRGVQGGLPRRHGRGVQVGPRAPAQADHRRMVCLPPAPGLRPVPGDRRRGGRVSAGGHGALRRSGGRRPAPVTGAARAHHHHHHAQDAGRAARGSS